MEPIRRVYENWKGHEDEWLENPYISMKDEMWQAIKKAVESK